MTEIFNKSKQLKQRRYLRKMQIKPEKLLWQKLRNRPVNCKFRRQFGIGKYIVDFYCGKLRLVIEVYGATHCTPEQIRNKS